MELIINFDFVSLCVFGIQAAVREILERLQRFDHTKLQKKVINNKVLTDDSTSTCTNTMCIHCLLYSIYDRFGQLEKNF